MHAYVFDSSILMDCIAPLAHQLIQQKSSDFIKRLAPSLKFDQ